MNLAQQRRIIALTAMLVFALGFLSHAQKGQLPTARFLIGTGGIFTVISIFADLGLAIGAGMAMVVGITAILTEGGPVIQLLNERSGVKAAVKSKVVNRSKEFEEIAPGVVQSIRTNPRRTLPGSPGVAGPPKPPGYPFQVPSLGQYPQH